MNASQPSIASTFPCEADAKLRRKLACRAARAEAAGFVGEATEPPAEVQPRDFSSENPMIPILPAVFWLEVVNERPLKEQKILGLDGKFVGCLGTVSFGFSHFAAILLDLALRLAVARSGKDCRKWRRSPCFFFAQAL